MKDPSEKRDVKRAIAHWERNVQGNDRIPWLDTFDFSPMRGDWGYRFLICGDEVAENSVFVTYGPKFARLLGLPEKPIATTPFLQQIPELYRDMFAEGYSKAIIELQPVTLNGTFSRGPDFELFRAAFMPILSQPNWSKQLVFGTYNCRTISAK